ncbi:MAG: prepilin-type N-terminal cleavage/methylation domain-containing protein [Candidatus Aminicenantes bacterium]|nr:prepilin-type N-terminal cleavage/methylation domain-containing protein [Candidatus Aminicenantes bacterium]
MQAGIIRKMRRLTESALQFQRKGFSLIEVLVGMALVTIAVVGLSQLFLLSLANNQNSDRISSATFLAQQHIDHMRTLTAEELNDVAANPVDEEVDVNNDGIYDYRRIIVVTKMGYSWRVRLLVFTIGARVYSHDDLVNDPVAHRVKTDISTLISR